MRVVISIGTALIFAFLGTALLCMPFSDNPSIAIALAFSSVAGLWIGRFLGNALKYERTPRLTQANPQSTATKRPFSERLQQFGRLTSDNIEPTDNRESQMAFWMANLELKRTPPRSSALIGRILNRIRTILSHDGGSPGTTP